MINSHITGVCRWSKIAKHLPGRTDNEIKNFWRTRIQKHIKQAESFPRQSSELNDQASTSQISGTLSTTEAVDSYPAQTYQENLSEALPGPLPTDPHDSFWTMEDFWSMQLLNGD